MPHLQVLQSAWSLFVISFGCQRAEPGRAEHHAHGGGGTDDPEFDLSFHEESESQV